YGLDGVAIIEYRNDENGLPISFIRSGFLDGQVYEKTHYPLKGSLAEEMKSKASVIIDRHLIKYAANNSLVQDGQYEAFIGKFLATEADHDIGIFVVSKRAIYNTDEIVAMLSMVGARLLADYNAEHIRIKNEHQERDSRLLFDQSAEPLFVLDSSGRILLSNYRAALLTGYNKDELISFFSLISVEHQPFFRNFFQKKSGVLNHSNLLLLTKGNQQVYCDLSGVILSDGRIQLSIRDTSEKRLAELAIKESEEKYRSIFNNASDAMFLSDWNTGKFIDCNGAFCDLMGLTRSEVLQSNHIDIIGKKDRERFRHLYQYFQTKKILERKSAKFRIVVDGNSGTMLPVEIAITQIDRAGGPAILGIIRDLSASYQAVEEHRKYLQTLSILKGIVVELDNELMIRSIYNSSNKFGGANGQNLAGTYFPDIVEEDFQWYIEMVLQELLQNRKPKTVRFPCLSNQTGMDWYEAEFVIVRDRSSKARIRGLIKDVTFEYIVEKQTYFMSNTDMLTSLPNRNRLEEDLFRAMLRADRKSKKLAIGFIDLDRFFDVNDLLGHRLGDVTIALMAEKLRSFPELERSLYRWGGDQFVFLLEDIDDLDTVRNLLSAIRLSMREPLTIEDQNLHVTGTVGVSLYPDDARTIDNLF
ncbi:MAG: sensor domain-containing diguanylate cyclase, partial [Leptonema sp. (in: Bacteria)]|nr:sensor domain-containing diguanylate cyclase [Leptonema sp. (in: bacteria)]